MGVFDSNQVFTFSALLNVPEPILCGSVDRAALVGTLGRWVSLDLLRDLDSAYDGLVSMKTLQGPTFTRDTLVVACCSNLPRDLRVKISSTKPGQRYSNGYVPLWSIAGFDDSYQEPFAWPFCVPRGHRLRVQFTKLESTSGFLPEGNITFRVIEVDDARRT